MIGVSPERSLSFASRSLTLALATPATQNLHGDLSLVAALCITSGIMGVLLGPRLLGWIGIPEGETASVPVFLRAWLQAKISRILDAAANE